MTDGTKRRKSEHINICLSGEDASSGITNGLEMYRFTHNPLPEIDFQQIDTSTSFLGKSVKLPFIISSMTGGTNEAWEINKNLAKAAQLKGMAMGIGSVRAAIEDDSVAYSFQIRDVAPTIPLVANLGAVQFNYGYGVEHCRKAVEISDADALVLHLNSLQEIIQPGGNSNFSGMLRKIEEICNKLDIPVGVKEVGWGITNETAQLLWDVGVHFVDVSGAGGTSWSQVEKFRTNDLLRKQAAETFANWGNSTAECLLSIKESSARGVVIGSGGMQNGLDAAKAIALGADLVGFGRSILQPAVHSTEQLLSVMDRLELELQIAMFGIGVDSIPQLKATTRLKRL